MLGQYSKDDWEYGPAEILPFQGVLVRAFFVVDGECVFTGNRPFERWGGGWVSRGYFIAPIGERISNVDCIDRSKAVGVNLRLRGYMNSPDAVLPLYFASRCRA